MSKKPKKKSTALARRGPTRIVVRDPQRLLPAQPVESATINSEATLIGALGKVTFKLSKAQTKILMRAVDVKRIRVKPTGAIYLPHADYTRWFNEAFGIGQWAIVPAGKPASQGRSVNVPYVLYVNGVPAAFAVGEQEYFEQNAQQTLGDAIESTVASGLRRCAKRLGVGLEMWDRSFANEFLANHAVAVRVRRGQKTVTMWRLKTDQPFAGEAQQGSHAPGVDDVFDGDYEEAPHQRAREPEQASSHAKSGEKISDKQVNRLLAIARSVGRHRSEIELWLNSTRGYESIADIKRHEYDAIVSKIEKGTLEG